MSKKAWEPLNLDELPDCTILACDPSLTALGLVLFEVRDSEVAVHEAEKLTTAPTEMKGWEDTFYRAELMEAIVSALVSNWLGEDWSDIADLMGVHEAPPAGGGNMVRTESSILTGYGFRSVCNEFEIPIGKTVTPQSHKKLITGNHLASKKQLAESIITLLPKIRNGSLIKNEATRDALSIALYASWRMKNG